MAFSERGTLPSALRKGDTIAFISPSGRLNDAVTDRVSRAKTCLERLGCSLEIIFSSPLPKPFKDAVQQRCEELHTAFRTPSIKAIICTIGGLSSNERLRHLDYDLIRANPKIFVGYSDITLLHYALFTQANLRTFYGPAAITQFGEFPQPLAFSLDHFMHVLTEPRIVGLVPRSTEWTQEFLEWASPASGTRARLLTPNPGWKWLRPGRAEGRIFGGCLPSILQLRGTKFEPSYEGRILILETPDWDAPSRGTPLAFVRSYIADLVNAGIMGAIAGLVVGRPYMYDEDMSREFEQMVLDQCHETTYPILANMDIGHTDPILTMPLNALARLDSGADVFEILEAAVE
jgi:muramoyltetrapeptide carboxypeptidase LdcA involved in peptidoglycan recycling